MIVRQFRLLLLLLCSYYYSIPPPLARPGSRDL